MPVELTQSQIKDLARPLTGLVEEFFRDPKNEEAFNKWLQNVENPQSSEIADAS